MTSAIFKFVTPALLILGLGILGYAIHIRSGVNSDGNSSDASIIPPEDVAVSHKEVLPADTWSVFQNSGEPVASKNDRYRLAGTFFVMGNNETSPNTERQRRAIIDDVSSNQQYMVSEGQTFQEYEILRIYQDRLIMRRDAVEVELTLSFQSSTRDLKTSTASDAQKSDVIMGQEVLESNRFGKRIGEKRWVIDKKAIVGYYQELLDQPERIAAVYMSMKPDFDDEGEVEGFTLQKEGEKEFFDAVGLLEGDTIRKVNSMRMTSQKRAEYFISEFMNERLGAVVLDIEREGKPEKLIYLFR